MPDEIIHFGDKAAGAESPSVIRVREQAATALEQGLGFVQDYGDELALLRAHVVLEVAAPVDVVEQVANRQRDDGSFEPLGGGV